MNSTRTPEAVDPTARIAALERRCRALGWVSALALFLGAFCVLVLVLKRIDMQSGKVRAQGFVLEDFDGRVRANLDLAPSEREVFLELKDVEGKTRLFAMVDGGGIPSIQLRDKDGVARMGFGVLPDGSPAFTLNGTDAAPRAAVRVDGDSGRVILRSGEGEPFVLPPKESGQ